jgi:hypothetical protein
MPIKGYIVQRAEAGAMDFKDLHPGEIVPVENHSFVDLAVRPVEPYKYRVLAINGIDDENFQDVSGYTQFQAVGASPPPENVTARSPILATAIFVDWSPVAPQEWGGNTAPVLAYRLYGNDGLDGAFELLFDGSGAPSTRYFNHTGLVPGRSYRYAVSVINLAGEGPMSIVRTFLAAVPPSAPSRPELVRSTKKSLTIQWSPPVSLGGGVISKYVVFHDFGLSHKPEPHMWMEICDTSAMQAEIKGFEPGSTVRIQIQAFGSSQNADPTDPTAAPTCLGASTKCMDAPGCEVAGLDPNNQIWGTGAYPNGYDVYLSTGIPGPKGDIPGSFRLAASGSRTCTS